METTLDREVRKYLQAALAPSTRRAYTRYLAQYLTFCKQLAQDAVPATPLTIARYVALLASSYTPQTILGHLAAIRLLLITNGTTTDALDDPLVRYTMRGVTKVIAVTPKQMKPITTQLLKRLLRQLDLHLHGDRLFWAAALLMFFSLLRRSNVLATNHSGHSLLRRADVAIFDDHMSLSVRVSKTRAASQPPHLIVLPARPGHCLCPVGAMRVALDIAPTAAAETALLQFPNGQPYMASSFMAQLRHALNTLAEPAASYGCHSFRRGGATHAFQSGARTEQIKRLGDWKSEAYTRYVATPSDSSDTTRSMIFFS
jgi:integrase